MIAILGTGLLGSGFARALLRDGNPVRVWNRTAERARALVADGATAVAGSPADAVHGVERVHVVLADDAAVDSVLAAAAPGFAPGVLVFDHSTTSPQGALERTARWRAGGVTYVHAPVFMGPQSALARSGTILVSGDRDLVARVTPLLASMTGNVLDVGPRVERAAQLKLFGNLQMLAFVAGFVDMLALARAMGITPGEAAALLEHIDPGPSLVRRFKRITQGEFDQPTWDLAMARKDAGLMLAEAERAGAALHMLPPLAALMDDMIARGFQDADWTVVARDLVLGDGDQSQRKPT